MGAAQPMRQVARSGKVNSLFMTQSTNVDGTCGCHDSPTLLSYLYSLAEPYS
jgi:hypothetical protein